MESSQKLVPRLVIIEGKDKGKILTLKAGMQTLGRAKAEILINDPRISRSHVSIQFDPELGTVVFSDLNSLNGTLINGEAKTSGEIKDGDQITLGDTRLDLQILEAAPEITAQKHLAELLHKTVPENMGGSEAEKLEPPVGEKVASEGNVEPPSIELEPEAIEVKPKRRLRLVVGSSATLILVGVWGLFSNMKRPELAIEERLKAISDLTRGDRWDEALAQSIELASKYPRFPQPHFELGVIYSQMKKIELAIGAYQKAHALEGAPSKVHARLLRLYGLIGAKDGMNAEMEHVDSLIKNGPYDRDTFVEIAMCFIDLRDVIGDSFERPYILSKALQKEIAPNDPIGYKLEAQVMALQGRYKDAIPILEKTMELAPTDEWPLENLTFAHLKLSDNAKTESSAMEWIRRHPASAKPHLVMAYLKVNGGNSLEALPYAQRVISFGDKEELYPEALSIVGQVYLNLEQTVEAETALRESCGLGFQPSCELIKPKESAPPSSP